MRKKPYNIVDDCVDRQKKRKNHKTALILVTETASGLKSKKYSFATLSKKIERFSKTLNEPKGSRVIVQLPNSLEFIVTFLGAMKAGLIPIPVSPQLTDSELGFIINDSGARIIFSERSHLTLTFQGREDAIGPTVKGGVAAFWLYTSGTTGTPKAVMHAHTSIPAHDARVTYWMDLKKNDILFNTSALNWSYAITSLLDAWRHGVTTVVYVGDQCLFQRAKNCPKKFAKNF
ncbi:MAG: acyl-CoA synthetase [Deltaproteobacteria bacterium]|nr:MAG: acyl-CoA synthetase [Deltaproteobacteria bacterium]